MTMAHSESSSSSPGYGSNSTASNQQCAEAPAGSDSAFELEALGPQNTSSGQSTSPRNVTTPAMLTLGRDGSDFAEGLGLDQSTSNRDTYDTDTDHRPWWDRVTNALNISSSTTEQASDSLQSSSHPGVAHYRSNSGTAETSSKAVYTSLENTSSPNNNNINGHGHGSAGGGGYTRTMPGGEEMREERIKVEKAEDLLQQDCSFFYQGMKSPPRGVSSNGGRRMQRLRALVRPQQPHHQGQSLFEYRDSVDVLAPPVLANYRARYQQLNQILRVDSDEDLAASAGAASSMHHHDLELMAEGDGDGIALTKHSNTMNSNNNAMMAQTVENSSLFYMLHGRMLMRLPRDQVTLVMDNDLEAGILSVEQWRSDDYLLPEQDTTAANHAGSSRSVPAAEVSFQDRPPLRYVLTVHDDLYRRIVAEMSEGLYKPYWGLSGCLNENERVDIRVAIAVMAVIMFVLLINTFIWPVE
jgi:hypothetical protein